MAELAVPKLNSNDVSYTLVEWLVADGQRVTAGDPVVVVETSKAAEELAGPADGILRHMLPAGSECRCGDVIARVLATLDAAGPMPPATPSVRGQDGPVLTDSARSLVAELGLSTEELSALNRTVLRRADIERLVSAPSGVAESGGAADGPDRLRHELTRGQQAVAAVVAESHRTIPTGFAVIRVVVGDALVLARQVTRRTRRLVGLPELLVKAIAGLREEFPLFFATRCDDRTVRLADTSHIGITIDVGTGLFVPVIRHAERLTCAEIADLIMDFRTQAIQGGFQASQLVGGTILVTLHNDADVVLAGPIVFPGQTCVVSLAGTLEELILDPAGQVTVRRVANVAVSYDHRTVNGRDAVLFLQEIKAALEAPQRWADA
jgi:2-oxoglutarate dehydrogenase E2 component (dihydrolipoamide succinyltransferase)